MNDVNPKFRIFFCHCTYAQVVPEDVKRAVLKKLCDANVAFDAVADLCEMAARRDPALQRLAAAGPVKIAACYPRAVKWLFDSAHASLAQETTEVRNMRLESADDVAAALLSGDLSPNLPAGKSGARSAPLTADS